jgi:hypothetical protein
MRIEVDSTRQGQAAFEAIEVLQDAGFYVGDYSISTEVESAEFGLEMNLSINQDERPVENVD